MMNLGPFFTRDEIEACRNKTFRLECKRIALKKRAPAGDREFAGRGFVEQSADGDLSFKIYSDQSIKFGEFLVKETRPGQIIPDSEYYDLDIIDVYNRNWISKRILSPNAQNNIIEGKTHEIHLMSANSDFTIERAILQLHIFEKIEIPANQYTSTTRKIGDLLIGESSQLNCAQFSTKEYEFMLISDDNLLEIFVTSETVAFPEHFEVRVVEALQFILSQKIRWSVLTKTERSRFQAKIRPSKYNASKSRLARPINAQDFDITGYFWKLFDNYLRYISDHEGETWHRLSSRIYRVIEASAYSMFTQALVLCTEIEGVLNDEYKKTELHSDDYPKLIEDLRSHLNLWQMPNLNNSLTHQIVENEYGTIKIRLGGLLSQLTDVRAKDKLLHLLDVGIIEKKEYDAWDYLRNKLAHAAMPDSFIIQEFVDQYHATLVLFYRLIFYIIGYEGKFTDYSTLGYPFKNFSFKKDEELS